MAEQLKNMFFTSSSMDKFGDTIKQFYPDFDKKRFLELLFDRSWDAKELKERMRHTAICLHETLPESYEEALTILKKAVPHIKGFEAMALPDYVELFGRDDWDLSLPALAHFTKYSSSEFAIRPFLAEDQGRVMSFMSALAEDDDHNVRRFASEGCRPRLPWGMALPAFKKDPSPILPILEKLTNDESEFVRKSVANNLNDISKDHPELVLDICERWYGHSKNTDWIIKRACRSMLKAGNKRALMLFGFGDPANLQVENLELDNETIRIGEDLYFSFDLIVKGKKRSKVRLEYCVYYAKPNGRQSKKIFKLTEGDFEPGEHTLSRKRSFQDMSTRKHFEGEHQISIVVNGEEKAKTSFFLEKAG